MYQNTQNVDNKKWLDIWINKLNQAMQSQNLNEMEQSELSGYIRHFLKANPRNPLSIKKNRIQLFIQQINPANHKKASYALLFFYTYVKPSISHVENVNVVKKEADIDNDKGYQSLLLNQLVQQLKLENKSERTIQSYIPIIKNYLTTLNKRPTVEDRDFIETYLINLKEITGLAPNTINQRVAAIQKFYRVVLNAYGTVSRLPKMKVPDVILDIYNKDEIKKLIKAHSNPKHKLIIIIAYATGLRLNEIRLLKPEHIDFSNNFIIVRQGKGGKDRTVTLDPFVKDRIVKYLESKPETPYIFPGRNKSGPLSRRAIHEVFEKACSKAGVRKIKGIHSMRHAFSTHIINDGVDATILQKLLGHKDMRTTQKYIHLSNRDIANVRTPIHDIDLD